ncbi:MAG TPA: ABC transporter ATP-binding protein [Dehalococcoidales bacterium]|nr:ABC transporter ATP-binding protein [Dehalococcoidales bacterium]
MKNAGNTIGDIILKTDNLCKSYVKGVPVNDNVCLSLFRGEVFGLLGSNGAGKTTLVRQMIGLAKPDSGSIRIDGIDIVAHPGYARQACSFQAQTQVPIAGLTARQAIILVGEVRGGDAKRVGKRADELLNSLEMENWSSKTAEVFSGGVRRLVAFCMAAVVPGRIVILDEPTNDIDPLRRRLLWQQVRNLVSMGSTVFLVTHNVLEAERAVDRLAIMDHGKVVSMGTPASLKGNESENMRFELILEPKTALKETPGFLKNTVATGRRLIGRLKESDVWIALQWAQNLKETGIAEEYSVGPITLEDVYLRVLGHDDARETTEKEANYDAPAA